MIICPRFSNAGTLFDDRFNQAYLHAGSSSCYVVTPHLKWTGGQRFTGALHY